MHPAAILTIILIALILLGAAFYYGRRIAQGKGIEDCEAKQATTDMLKRYRRLKRRERRKAAKEARKAEKAS